MKAPTAVLGTNPTKERHQVRALAKAPSAGSTTPGSGSTFSLGLFATMLACAAAFLGIGAPAASAAPEAVKGWSYQGTIGSGNNNYFELARNPIAVDSHGNVFVANEVSGPANAYSSTGTFLGQYNLNAEVRNLAVDPVDDTIYVDPMFGGPTIARFVSDGSTPPTYTVDPDFSAPVGAGLAVDPTTQELLVPDPGAEAVRRYDSSGALVDTISTPSISPTWIAAAADGSFYVAPDGGSDITHFSGAGAVLGTITGVGSLQGLTFDSVNEVLVAAVGDKLKSYGAGDALVSEVSGKNGSGLGSGTGRLYEITPSGSIFSDLNVYDWATIPGVETPTISEIEPKSAHLSAEVDPGAGPPTESVAHFEYSADGGANWKETPAQELTSPGATEISADLDPLLPNTEYLVRVVISNSLASRTSDTTSFSTPQIAPEVLAANATDVSETSAVLNGTITPFGLQTSYYFEYGTTATYGSRFPVGIDSVAGNGYEPRAFSGTINGLEPGTTYHFRIVATNAIGTTQGDDRTFTTAAVGGIPHRSYEQVTPVDKQGNPLDPNIGFQAKADGSAIAYVNRAGKQGSPQYAFAMSRRGTADWEAGIDLSVPLNATTAIGGIIGGTTLAISNDFRHTLVATNRALTPGANEGGGNLYIVDLDTNSYTLVATHPFPFSVYGFIQVQTAYRFQGGTSDFSSVIFEAEFPFIDGAPAQAIYRWSESGGLEVVSTLPNGDPVRTGRGGNDKTPAIKTVSEDGSRIYFTVPANFNTDTTSSGVYLHELGKPTKAISVSQIPGDPETPKNARLMGISKDGRYAFIMVVDGRLTADAPEAVLSEGGEEGPLYRYDADDGSIEYTGAVARQDPTSNSNGFENALGVSDDGGTAYFVSPAGVEVWRDGVTHLIEPGDMVGRQFTQASPSGRYFVYETGSRDNGIRGDVYLYDSDTNQKSCASCLPDGSPGYGYLPSGERYISDRLPQVVTEAGAVFFTSSERLVAADVNGINDVYEYQNHKPSLISTGNRNFEATLADISEDGSDVFFITNQKLVGRDNDETPDIYDARIGGGFASQNPPPVQECLRDDCKATPNAGPELPFGGSEALSGPGNVTPPKRKHCGKGKRAKKVKGKVRCVKKHKANKSKKGGNR
jgi:hypothetical protein